MIYRLRGNIIEIKDNFVVIDVQGVGYGVFVPERLTAKNLLLETEANLYVVTIVREDDISLYGFNSPLERNFFNMLLQIPRMGPKGALKILSSTSALTIMQTIMKKDLKNLSQLPGIGKKLAERLILELHEKVKKILEKEEVDIMEDPLEEAVEVLTELGCSQEEAREVLSRVQKETGDEGTPEDLIAHALSLMAEGERNL